VRISRFGGAGKGQLFFAGFLVLTVFRVSTSGYGVATDSKLREIIGLSCRI